MSVNILVKIKQKFVNASTTSFFIPTGDSKCTVCCVHSSEEINMIPQIVIRHAGLIIMTGSAWIIGFKLQVGVLFYVVSEAMI